MNNLYSYHTDRYYCDALDAIFTTVNRNSSPKMQEEIKDSQHINNQYVFPKLSNSLPDLLMFDLCSLQDLLLVVKVGHDYIVIIWEFHFSCWCLPKSFQCKYICGFCGIYILWFIKHLIHPWWLTLVSSHHTLYTLGILLFSIYSFPLYKGTILKTFLYKNTTFVVVPNIISILCALSQKLFNGSVK